MNLDLILNKEIKNITSKIANQIDSVAQQYEQDFQGELAKIISNKGKMVRANVVALFAKAGNQFDSDSTVKLGAGIEILHLASLVHDDVIDNAHIRRNRKTLMATFDNKIAILMGDLLVAEALKLIHSVKKNNIVGEVIEVSKYLAMGEIYQMQNLHNIALSRETYYNLIYYKTGKLFELATNMGCQCANLDPQTIKVSCEFGKSIGISFQMIDDVIDYEAKSGNKAPLVDLMERKTTLPIILLLENMGEFDKKKLSTIWASKDTPKDNIEWILGMMEEYKIFSTIRSMCQKNILHNLENLKESQINTVEIEKLTHYCINRMN